LKALNESLAKNLAEAGQAQKTQLEAVAARLEKLSTGTDQKIEAAKASLEAKLKSAQDDAAKQLDQLRNGVTAGVQGAEKRLGESLAQAAQRLERVEQGLAARNNTGTAA
jgi:DNA anti-recombination protein RmuC